MKFNWDENKARKVKDEHKIDFEKIKDVFDDPFAIEFTDEIHFITARKAENWMVKNYEQNRRRS